MKRIYISNEKETTLGCVRFILANAIDPHQRLGGAVFSLYKRNEKKCCYEKLLSGLLTGENGVLIIDRLEPGQYMLTENTAPEGYLFEFTKVFFNIEMDRTGRVIELDTILIFNYPNRRACPCGYDYSCFGCGCCENHDHHCLFL